MPDSAVDLVDLVDLKMLPAWVNEPAQGERYAQVEGGRISNDAVDLTIGQDGTENVQRVTGRGSVGASV